MVLRAEARNWLVYGPEDGPSSDHHYLHNDVTLSGAKYFNRQRSMD
jgi:hypothetical protein